MHHVVLVQKMTNAHVAGRKRFIDKGRLVLSRLLEDSKTTQRKTPVPPLSDELNELLLDVVKETFRAFMILGLLSDIT